MDKDRDKRALADVVHAHVTTEEPANPRLGWHLSVDIFPKVPKHLIPSWVTEDGVKRWFDSAISGIEDPRLQGAYGRVRLPSDVPWPRELEGRTLQFVKAAFRLSQMGIDEITPEHLAPIVGLQPSTTYIESNGLVKLGIFRRVRPRVYASLIDPDTEFWIPARYHDLTEGRFTTLRQEDAPTENQDAVTFSLHHDVLRGHLREAIKVLKHSIAEQEAVLSRLEAEEAALNVLPT